MWTGLDFGIPSSQKIFENITSKFALYNAIFWEIFFNNREKHRNLG